MDKFLPSGGERGGLGATLGPRLADAASGIFPGVKSTQDWLSSGGGTGPMGGTFLPRAANWASKLGIQGTPASRGTGIFGGTWGPALADFFGFDRGTGGGGSGIQEFDMSTIPAKRRRGEEVDTSTGYVSQGTYGGSSSAFPKGK